MRPLLQLLFSFPTYRPWHLEHSKETPTPPAPGNEPFPSPNQHLSAQNQPRATSISTSAHHSHELLRCSGEECHKFILNKFWSRNRGQQLQTDTVRTQHLWPASPGEISLMFGKCWAEGITLPQLPWGEFVALCLLWLELFLALGAW